MNYPYPPGPPYDQPPGVPPARPPRTAKPHPTQHFVIPTDDRALEIYAIGGTITVLVAELTFNPLAVGAAEYEIVQASQNLRDSTPFRAAGKAWSAIADDLTGGATCDDPLQSGATGAAKTLATDWQGPASETFSTFISGDFATNIGDLAKAARASATYCDGVAGALDDAFNQWIDAGTETITKLIGVGVTAGAGAAIGSFVPGLGTLIGGVAGAVIGILGDFLDYSRKVQLNLAALVKAVDVQADTLHGTYTALAKHFGTKAGSITTAALAPPGLTAGSIITTPKDWTKKPVEQPR